MTPTDALQVLKNSGLSGERLLTLLDQVVKCIKTENTQALKEVDF